MSKKNSLISMLFLSLLAIGIVCAEEAPTPQQALKSFGVSAEQIRQLESGEIISYEVSETTQKELAMGVAMLLPAKLVKIVEYIKSGRLTATETDIIATGVLDSKAKGMKKFAFTKKDFDEAKAFLLAEPGDKFNLSKPELDSLKSAQATLKTADNKTLLTVASQKYREFLLQRLQAYQKTGLAGIANYSRENGSADPREELRIDANSSKGWINYYPELHQAWLNYPVALPVNAVEQFAWMNRRVEDRPTAILNHQIILANDQIGIIISRQFYVGHSYNSSQVTAGGIPYGEGTLVFYTIHSSTDQVAGMGVKLKHLIGRDKLKEEMIKRLNRLKAALK